MSPASQPRIFAVAAAMALGALAIPTDMAAELKIWKVDSMEIGGFAAETWGDPATIATEAGPALRFDGVEDGLLIPDNPIAVWPRFTIEILFRPEAGGGRAQRFLHLGEPNGQRVLIELRMNDDGSWFLDTFILSGENRLALADSTLLHPPNDWFWAALTYDGTRMAHFVNGQKELEGAVAFQPLAAGRTSIGARMTRESWFKGAIREVRFHDRVVPAGELQTVGAAGKKTAGLRQP